MLLDANDLLNSVRKAAREAVEAAQPAGVVFGKVISAKPLKVLVEQKMTLNMAQLVLTRNVTEFQTKISVQWESEESSMEKIAMPHKHKITGKKEVTIHNGLGIGDEVIIMRQQGGQKYVVIDRVGT